MTQPLLVEENFTLGRTEKETSQFERLPIQLGVLPTPRAPGGLLDLILDGDVPSRFQNIPVPYTNFSKMYTQFFKNIYPTLYQFSENAYPILYQLQKLRKSIPFVIPKSWKTIPFPMARPRTQNMYSTPPPGSLHDRSYCYSK